MTEQNLTWKDWLQMSPTLTHLYHYPLIQSLTNYLIECRICQLVIRSVPFQVVVTVLLWGLNRLYSKLPWIFWLGLYLDKWIDKIWLTGVLNYFLRILYLAIGMVIRIEKPAIKKSPTPKTLVLDNLDQLTATPQTSGTFDVVSVDYKTEIRDKDGTLTTPLKRDSGSTVQTSNEASVSNDH
ncbi:hypothetical protein MOSE0_J03862 [Monosporozyma servazzii]